MIGLCSWEDAIGRVLRGIELMVGIMSFDGMTMTKHA